VAWLKEYVKGVDVVLQNMRPGSLEELGLGADVLRAINPRLVYCSLWAFGKDGPLKLRPGYEPMVQAFAGLMAVNGDEDSPPTRIGTSVLDFGTGMWAAMGALGGLVQRQATGRVAPEKFTHGSSAQRVQWFRRGLDSGNPDACDTFGTATR